MPDDLPGLHPYAAATQKLREAAKWLLAAAAGVGGLLVAGLQLGSLGELTLDQWPRITTAIVGLAVALSGAGALIAKAARLLTEDWVTLAELAREDVRERLKPTRQAPGADAATIYSDIGDYKEELYGHLADTPEQLYDLLKKANEASRQRIANGSLRADDAARSERELREAVQTVVEFANYRRTRANFKSLEKVLLGASVAVVAGVTTFAIAAYSPDTKQESSETGTGAGTAAVVTTAPTVASTRPTASNSPTLTAPPTSPSDDTPP